MHTRRDKYGCDQTLPVEIWADMLEDQGVDTSELRAWLVTAQGMEMGIRTDLEMVMEMEMGVEMVIDVVMD